MHRGTNRHFEVDGILLDAAMAETRTEALQYAIAGAFRIRQLVKMLVIVSRVLIADRPRAGNSQGFPRCVRQNEQMFALLRVERAAHALPAFPRSVAAHAD